MANKLVLGLQISILSIVCLKSNDLAPSDTQPTEYERPILSPSNSREKEHISENQVRSASKRNFRSDSNASESFILSRVNQNKFVVESSNSKTLYSLDQPPMYYLGDASIEYKDADSNVAQIQIPNDVRYVIVEVSNSCIFPIVGVSLDKNVILNTSGNTVSVEADYFSIDAFNKLNPGETTVYNSYDKMRIRQYYDIHHQKFEINDNTYGFANLTILCLEFEKPSDRTLRFAIKLGPKAGLSGNSVGATDKVTYIDVDADDSYYTFGGYYVEKFVAVYPDSAVIFRIKDLLGLSYLYFDTLETENFRIGLTYTDSKYGLRVFNYTSIDADGFQEIREREVEVQIFNLGSSDTVAMKMFVETYYNSYYIGKLSRGTFIALVSICSAVIFVLIIAIIFTCFRKRTTRQLGRNTSRNLRPGANVDHRHPEQQPGNNQASGNSNSNNFPIPYTPMPYPSQLPNDHSNINDRELETEHLKNSVIRKDLVKEGDNRLRTSTYKVDINRLEKPELNEDHIEKEFSMYKS